MLPALAISGLASVASSAIAKSGSSGSQSSPPQESGIMSSLQGSQPNNQPAVPEVSGSQSQALGDDMAKDAFKTGFNAVMGKGISSAMTPSATQQGRDQKNYLAAAFPEMNPWERAGASATQQGVQMAQNKQAASLQAQQIQGQKDVARINGENQVKVAEIQSGTSRYGSDTSAAASRYGADSSSGASRYASDTSAKNVESQIASLRKKVAADTKLALEKATTEAEATSTIGKMAKDTEQAINRIISAPIGIKEGSMTDKFIKNELPKIKNSFTDFFNDAGKWYDSKFKRDSAGGVQSSHDAGNKGKFSDDSNYVKGLK